MPSRKRIVVAAIIFLCASLPAAPGKFHGFNKKPEEVVLQVPSSPEVVVPFHTLALKVDNPTGSFPYAQQLRASIDKELTGAFSIVPSGGEGTLTVSVLEFAAPASRVYTSMEARAGQPANTPNSQPNNQKKGWASSVLNSLNVASQKVPVQYWEANGQVTLKSVLTDKTGASIDETILKAPFAMRREVAVNNVASVDPASLPQQNAILTYLLLEGARKVRHRYAVGLEPTVVKLPIDGELQPGNRLAIDGNWDGALNAWKSVSTNSNPGDQPFVMAVATYALAFKAFAEMQDVDAATPQLAEASRLLSEAEKNDPKEAYFREFETRMTAAKLEIDKAGQQAKALALRRSRATTADEASAPAAGSKSLEAAPASADSGQAAEFRKYIRLQWKKRTQPPTAADLTSIQEAGQLAWKLSPEQSRAVVTSEAHEWQERKSKQDLYFNQLKGFLEGGVLSAEGRSQLRKLSANLGLRDDEVAAVESRISFREEGKSRAGIRK